MSLDDIITTLAAEDPTRVLPYGFDNPHSYRGYYEDVAFEPATDISVGDMLEAAQSALGATYTAWKGGEFQMAGYSDCWLSMEGSASGESIGPTLLRLMLAAGKASPVGPTATQPAAEARVVAYRAPSGYLYCPNCCSGTGMYAGLTSDDLPDGGLCDECGVDVLIFDDDAPDGLLYDLPAGFIAGPGGEQ